MNYNFNNIPDELKQQQQWVLWKYEDRNGKQTKVPYRSTGAMASSNNNSTWTTFDIALKMYEHGGYDGIGFMFSENDEYFGIDLDNCFENGEFSELAKEIIVLMSSYTEFSPSGKGVHIIAKGELPDGYGRKSSELGIECYSSFRYFSFTGNVIANKPVNERTKQVKRVCDKFLKRKTFEHSTRTENNHPKNEMPNEKLWTVMFNSKNGKSIKELYDGYLINNDHSSSDLALCNHLAFWTNKDAIKMDSMFRESSLVRDKWDKRHSNDGRTYGQMTIDTAIISTPSTIADFKKAQSEAETSDTNEVKPTFHLTELGNAERIIHEHGEDLKYCNELEWLIWNGKRWEQDNKRKIEALAVKTLRKIYDEAAEADEYNQKLLNNWARNCEKRSIRVNSILDARPMVSVLKSDFDSHKWLFNCQNGVVDLKNGNLLPHDRDLLLTKISKVNYDRDAKCPHWMDFLYSIFKAVDGQPDIELINFMQKAIGYALTGETKEQVIFFLFGNGRNGKSTFINIIQDLMGDYGRQTNSETFIKKKNDSGINNDIARLDGARFVSAIESEEGQQLSESLVKQITGGEKMSARFLRQEYFEFLPEFKVFFTTNHKPIIKGSDEGIWRRIRLIPFSVTIPKHKIDYDLPQKLAKEMPGILNWAVEGCLKWQKEGLEEPDSVKHATSSYREDMDIIGPYMDENCSIDINASIEAKVLYDNYTTWCYYNHEMELKNRAFYRQLEIRGFKRERGNRNKIYIKGITLNDLAKKEMEIRNNRNVLLNSNS